MLDGGSFQAQNASETVIERLPVFREFSGFPIVALVDRDRIARRLEAGFDEGAAERLEKHIQELLAAD